ncbi:heme transporter hrg1-A-like [Zootermopsis nevadensis]|uniref:Heme transporter hrg-1 n=1 Tax=Zootermopsis nevadensis TaxID=136037 RepID=A0A067RIX9_ZOONE|nr:heme transporter hrg1-A-like [Zootermopsis nevadensis]KDR19233.1 Heme transporter hrg-1 [Zootermopsis nevadensis]
MFNNCKQWFHLVSSVVGAILGVSAFVVFFCIYENVDAAFWGLLSGVFAMVCFHLHYLYVRQKMDSWHSVDTLRSIKVLGIMGALAGMAGLIWCIFIAVYHHIPVMPVDTSMYIAAVWTFMTAKWGLCLFLYCRMYTRILSGHNPPLISV